MIPKFITLEGIEGSGKSTSLSTINNYLDSIELDYFNTREPGGGPIGIPIRKLLLDKKTNISPEVEMLLMLADRKDHVEQVIKPKLEEGKWVISDRYLDSTTAYQGGGRQLDLQKIEIVNSVLNFPVPDLTILFDLPVEEALERASKRSQLDRFESEPLEFHERIRQTYLELSQKEERFKIIDSSKNAEEVSREVIKIMSSFCNAGV
jgi:dTMP kinase|tara:strand:- start:4374 stop:4994 length:621 start_codon:yes stop_codon:yes gene_type:complete